MRYIWARIKQGGVWAYLLIPLVLLGVVWFLRKMFTPGAKPGIAPATTEDDRLARTLGEVSDRLAEANNKAAVEIAVARSAEVTYRAQLDAVMTEPDAKRRRRDLIALRKRTGL